RPGTWSVTQDYLEGELDAEFDALYELTYGKGSGLKIAGKDIITFRLRAVGTLSKPKMRRHTIGPENPSAALKGWRPVYFEDLGGFASTPIYQFEQLAPGMEIHGPAVIESPITTIVVNPKDLAAMDEYQNVRLFIGGERPLPVVVEERPHEHTHAH